MYVYRIWIYIYIYIHICRLHRAWTSWEHYIIVFGGISRSDWAGSGGLFVVHGWDVNFSICNG